MSLKLFFIGTFSFLLFMVADIMIRFSMVSYNSVNSSSQVYMTNIVHHKHHNKSNEFKHRKVFENHEEVKKSQNHSLPQEYKERISRIEENCKKYLGQSVNPEPESISIPSHIQFVPNEKVNLLQNSEKVLLSIYFKLFIYYCDTQYHLV